MACLHAILRRLSAPAIVRKAAFGGLKNRRWSEAQLAVHGAPKACRERQKSAGAVSDRLDCFVRLKI